MARPLTIIALLLAVLAVIFIFIPVGGNAVTILLAVGVLLAIAGLLTGK